MLFISSALLQISDCINRSNRRPPQLPAISGFTPINRQQLLDVTVPPGQHETMPSRPSMKSKQPSSKNSLTSAPKRRKTQTSSAAPISENTDGGRKNNRSKTQPVNHDISQGLPRTKPVQTGRKFTSREARLASKEVVLDLACPNFLDFKPPPSAQVPIPAIQEYPLDIYDQIAAADGTNQIVDEYTNVADHVSEDIDEYPMDDECLEEAMQSMIAPTNQDYLISEQRSSSVSSDIFAENFELDDDLQDWPEVPCPPDAFSIHDDTPAAFTDAARETSHPLGPQSSCLLTHISGNAGNSKSDPSRLSEGSENIFENDILDGDAIEITSISSDILQRETPQTSPQRPTTPKLQWLPPKIYVPANSSQALISPVKLSQLPISPAKIPQVPVSPLSPPKASHLLSYSPTGSPLPIIRPAFPTPIPDRSPIPGFTNGTSLRICFRIGEALNAAAAASRSNIDAIIELYARVVFSSRQANGGFKQFFQFGDLFTDKPPYLKGTYGLWKGVGLWDQDSRGFVGEGGKGKMARVVGRIRRGDEGVEMVILSVWEVGWEDVGIAKGVVCS